MPQIAGFRGVVVDPSKKLTDIPARIAKGELARDPSRALYRYHQIFRNPDDGRVFTRKSFFAVVRLAPWTDPSVRATEMTEPAQREMALASISSSSIQQTPVVAGYRDAAGEIERILRKADNDRPEIDVTVDDVTHRLWRVRDAEMFGKIRNTIAPKKIQVLEGHGVYEAMLAHEAKLDAAGDLAPQSTARYGLMCLTAMDDPMLAVAPRHRVLRGDLNKDAILAGAKPTFLVDKLAGAASNPQALRTALGESVAHQPAFVVIFKGDSDAWKLTLSPDVTATTEGVAVHRALHRLDPVIVDSLFTARFAKDATRSTVTSLDEALAAIKGGADAVALMRPVGMDQILHVADVGQTLPTGSTALYPPVLPMVAFVVEPELDVM